MIISKKLAFIISLALGIQFAAQTHISDTVDRDEILTFAQNLQQHNSPQAHNIAQWLNAKVTDSYEIGSAHIIQSIIQIVDSPRLTTESKITILSEMMAKERKDASWHKVYAFVSNVAAVIAMTGFMGCMMWITAESVKHPRPIIYTIRQDYRTPQITFRFPLDYWNF